MLAATRPLHVPPLWVRKSRWVPWYIGVLTDGAIGATGPGGSPGPSPAGPSGGWFLTSPHPQASTINSNFLIPPIVVRSAYARAMNPVTRRELLLMAGGAWAAAGVPG